MNTVYDDVLKSFHASFQDKVALPESLEYEWFLKAVGKYSCKLSPLNFDEDLLEFDCKLDRYVVDHLGAMMKEYYQRRELSKVNKRISIVGKDLSIDGSNGSKTAAKAELELAIEDVNEMTSDQMTTAYN